jgi:hypothetical protein
LQYGQSTEDAARAFEYHAASAAARTTSRGTTAFLGLRTTRWLPVFPAAVAEPEIVRLGDIEGRVIIVVLAATDEDLNPT